MTQTDRFNSGIPSPRTGAGITSTGKWMVLLAAFLGWMFDGLEMGIFPLVARPALENLLGGTDPAQLAAEIKKWHGIIDALFLLGAAAGGLVFGWFGDKIGRVKAMSISIFVYSIFTGLCYFAQSPLQIGLLRFISAIGMGGEWSLGVALVMEVWPAKSRPLLAGIIGAAANVGFATIGVAAIFFSVTQQSWRWVMLAGALPAMLTFFIRLFVPESERWQESQKKAPSKPLTELFSGGLTWITVLAICFASVALIGTWGSVQKIPAWVAGKELAGVPGPTAKAVAQVASAVGAIIGCMIAPFIGAWLGRRIAYFSLCALSLLACQVLFRGFHEYNWAFLLMVGVVGGVTAAFYGWLPLYLPELFPTRVRATAQGIAYNFGRIMAAGGAVWGGTLGGSYARMGAIVSMVYIIGMLLIWFAPETRGRPLPETADDVWRGKKRDRAEGFEPVMAAPVGAEQR
jgi:MFS transporter, SHS family, sialic acid transporter